MIWSHKALPLASLPMYLQSLKLLRPMVKQMHLQENTLFNLDPKVERSRSHEMLHSTLDIVWPMHQQFDVATSNG